MPEHFFLPNVNALQTHAVFILPDFDVGNFWQLALASSNQLHDCWDSSGNAVGNGFVSVCLQHHQLPGRV